MSPSLQDREALYRSQSRSPRDARIGALVSSIRAEEDEQAEQGLTYDDGRVRIAQVHGRQDLVLLCAQLGEVLRATDAHLALLRQIRWLLVALVLAVVWRFL